MDHKFSVVLIQTFAIEMCVLCGMIYDVRLVSVTVGIYDESLFFKVIEVVAGMVAFYELSLKVKYSLWSRTFSVGGKRV